MCNKDIDYPRLWYYMHYNAIYTTVKHFRMSMKMISENVGGKCGEGLKLYLKEHPITAKTKPFRYTWKLHNAVNKRIGKKLIGYKDARKLYT